MIDKGTATFKDDEYFRRFCVLNRTGMITAYLPDENIFAVLFGKGQWITFYWTEEQFLEKFDVVLAQND
jgi:hypothetical protein